MFITTNNKCTFKLCYIIPDGIINDNIWGYVSYVNPAISAIKSAYEQYFWAKLLHDTPSNHFKHKTMYNQYSCGNYDFKDADLFSKEEQQDDDSADSVLEQFYTQITKTIAEILSILEKHKRCVYFTNAIMKKEGYAFEPFQKSILYEHLFFYVQDQNPGHILNTFIMAMYDYFAFDYVTVPHICNMYTKKHYVSIIPRRHGKTLIIYAVNAAFLLAYKSLTIMAVAQSKNIIITTKKRILAFINIWSSELNISYEFPTQDNVLVKYGGSPQDSSLLICVGAHNDGSLRGPDPQLCIVDETMCIKPNRFNTILAYPQKKKM